MMEKNNTRLGQHASTVLTNRSGHITVVSELPYIERQKADFHKSFSKYGQYIRGSRPMHRTTFCFEKNPKEIEYVASTHKAYSGKSDLPHGIRPPVCQSLHRSHFYIGYSPDLDLSTQNRKHFNKKQLIPANKLHEDRARWNDQMMAGNLMNESLRHNTNQKMNQDTTYQNVYDKLGRVLPNGFPKMRQASDRYNIISGSYIGPAERSCHKLKSGNKVLQKIRMECNEGLLG